MKHVSPLASCLLWVVLACGQPLEAFSQTTDDNVLITESADAYVFKRHSDNTYAVENRRETDYLASRMGAKIRPSIVYGEFVKLDKANSKGWAQYENVNSGDVFIDDAKVCYFDVELDRKGKTASASFERTFLDPRYFTAVYLLDDYFIKQKRVTFTLPNSYYIVEKNMREGITKQRTENDDGTQTISYYLTDMPAMKSEPGMPSPLQVYPLVLVAGAFDNVQSLYGWFNSLVDTDCALPDQATLLREVGGGATSDAEKIANTYAWVQKNIRYVAVEAGIAGHKPDSPSEVLRKRYGDCKGMALLLRTLLRARGLDARLVYVGTDDIPFSPTEVPTLAATNHVVCAVQLNGRTLYLDATASHIPASHIPGNLQGREALTEQGERCQVGALPQLPLDASEDSLRYSSRLTAAGTLHVEAVAAWRGDCKEWALQSILEAESSDHEALMANAINSDDRSSRVTAVGWRTNDSRAEWAVMTGELEDGNAVQAVDNELYVELDPHNDVCAEPVDTAKRTLPYCLPSRCKTVREHAFSIPQGYTVASLPNDFRLQTPQGVLSCTFRRQGNEVVFRKVMELTHTTIALKHLANWNEALTRWAEACSENVVLRKQ